MIEGTPLKLMTWNVYLGGEIARVINVSPALLPRRTQQLWDSVRATNFPRRARAMAAAIARETPDVLALQEVFRWSTLRRDGLRAPVETLEYDFLGELQAQLAAAGAPYFVVSRSPGVNLVLPLAPDTDLRLEDSVVLLLREQPQDSPLAGLHWENARQARFAHNTRTRIDDEPFDLSRGWAGVDLRDAQGGVVRVVTTHMEYFDEQVKPRQVEDLLHVACGVYGPRILLGDFNSRPDSDTAQALRRNGYRDVWREARLGEGLTSGQDEDLRNEREGLNERLDWILARGPIRVRNAYRIGQRPEDRLPDGRWPSDHAAVVATLEVRMAERRVRPAPEENPDTAVEVVRRLFNCFIRKDPAGMMELLHPDARLTFPGDPKVLPWAGEFRGSGFMRFVVAVGALEYLEYRMKDIWGNGDRVVALSSERCRVRANNRIFDHDLAAIIRVKDGLIVEFLEFSDTGKMERALLGVKE